MPKKPRTRKAFEVPLSPEREQEITQWLCQEITQAVDARMGLTGPGGLTEYFLGLYEQFRTRTSKNGPWPGCADLTSYIGTEKVDSLRSRAVKSIFSEPIWTVEGFGKDAQRAPLVEEFHQWKAESRDERLQSYLSDGIHNALIEGVGVLEVSERADKRKVQSRDRVQVLTDEAGNPILDEKLKPQPVRDQQGAFVTAGPEEPGVDLVREDIRLIHRGPKYSVVALADFYPLPGHGKDSDEIWGYAKRCFLRVPTLKAREKDGIYQNVEALGEASEREPDPAERKDGQEIAAQRGPTAEKEIWEVDVLMDADEDGWEEWYKITLSVQRRVMLRIQRNDLDRHPYFLLVPFRNPKSWRGYAYIEKLLTIIEEHTAIRNQFADRSTLAGNAPIQKRLNSPWEPDDEPWGPGTVIPVQQIDQDIKQLVISDVPPSFVQREGMTLNAAERVGGQSDLMSGVQSSENRTLGENQMVMEGSLVRVEEVVRNLQETLEELGEYRNQLWIRALTDEPQGVQPPKGVMDSLSFNGLSDQLVDERFTADLLRGAFRFKPRGSVETADPGRMRNDFTQFLQMIGGMAGNLPVLQAWLNQPDTLKAIMEQAIRLFRFQNRSALLGALSKVLQEQAQQAQMAQTMGGMLPPGAGPMPPQTANVGAPRPPESRPAPGGAIGGGPGLDPRVLLQQLQARGMSPGAMR